MTNKDLLVQKIKGSGISMTHIAKKIGISREWLYKKINNESDFKASEILCIQDLLRLSEEERNQIFFERKVV